MLDGFSSAPFSLLKGSLPSVAGPYVLLISGVSYCLSLSKHVFICGPRNGQLQAAPFESVSVFCLHRSSCCTNVQRLWFWGPVGPVILFLCSLQDTFIHSPNMSMFRCPSLASFHILLRGDRSSRSSLKVSPFCSSIPRRSRISSLKENFRSWINSGASISRT